VSLLSWWLVVPSLLVIAFGVLAFRRSRFNWTGPGGRRARLGIALAVLSVVALLMAVFIILDVVPTE
jgi:hypothetical protein